jgi:hypothetical protein
MLIQSGILRNKILVTFLRATQNLVETLGITGWAMRPKKSTEQSLGRGA